MTEISINPDQSLSVRWTGKKGRGSLLQTMATGNVQDVNKLDSREMIAVMLAVKHLPFPLGHGEDFYKECLAEVEKKGADCLFPSTASDGELRKYLVLKAGEGCNAPWDSYIGIAAKLKKEAPNAESTVGQR